MSDKKYIKPGDDGVPEQAYGQVETIDFLATLDTSDGYRVKVISWLNAIRVILGGRTIGGQGQNDVTDNNSLQTLRNKTLRDPQIVITSVPGIDIQEPEIIDVEAIYNMKQTEHALSAAGLTDGTRLVEATENTPLQAFSAIIEKESSSGNEISLTEAEILAAAGLSGPGKSIDARSLQISVWLPGTDSYEQKWDWTASSTTKAGSKSLHTLTISMHNASTLYAMNLNFRLEQ